MNPARGLRPAVHSSSRGISRSAVLGPLLKREAFVMKWSRYPAIMAILVLGMAAYAPGARAITPITQCTTITQPGSYIVVQNLVAAGDCLVVAADFVSIHLAGSLLIGNGTGTGIRDSGLRKGITIHDG